MICFVVTGIIATENTTQLEDWYDASTATEGYRTVGNIGGLSLDHGYYGVLRIRHNGRWGLVCYDYQRPYDLTPVCRYLGYTNVVYSTYQSMPGQYAMLWNLRCPQSSYGVDQCLGLFESKFCLRKLSITCGTTSTLEYDTTSTGATIDATLTWYGRPSGIRLVNGSRPWEGRVELLVNGEWGTVCGNSFNEYDARVVCRMMGYGYGYNSGAAYGQGNGSILLDNVRCRGYESDISDCQSSGWYNHNCRHSQDAGVWCIPYTTPRPSTWTTRPYYERRTTISHTGIRLVNGTYPWEGRVELYHNNRWGTICDDNFDTQDARVICGMLGYNRYGSVTAYGNACFGSGSGSIMLDELSCYGTESDLSQCSSHGWFSNDCSHSEDASVSCRYQKSSVASACHVHGLTTEEATTYGFDETTHRLDSHGHIQIRLTYGNGGYLEVYHNGRWGRVCYDYYRLRTELDPICQYLGFSGVKNIAPSSDGRNGILDNLYCKPGTYSYGIDSCTGRFGNRYCNAKIYLDCESQTSTELTTSYYPGNTVGRRGIRLVNGAYPWEGRVEVYHNNRWGTICDDDFDRDDARVICGMLGYYRYGSVSAYIGAHFGSGSGSILLDNLHCSGYESDISQCRSNGWFSNNCNHNEDAGVSCRSSGSTETTEEVTTYGYDETTHRIGNHGHIPLRLTYGNSGFLEVNHNGRWGRVCYNNQNRAGLDSVCKYLGYSRVSYLESRYDGQYSILDQLVCSPWTYSYGIDSCTGRFGNRYCGYKIYLTCDVICTDEPNVAKMTIYRSRITYNIESQTSTEITPTFSSGCKSTIPADVIFVVDASGSVGTGNFDSTRHSITDTIRHLEIKNDFIRVGLMTFDGSSYRVFNLNSYPGNVNNMVSRVMSMSYSGGSTNIANALYQACNTMFTSFYGDRSNIQNYLVLLTDGQSDANAAQMRANSCKSAGTRIISIGIGDSIDENMLQNVAYNYDYYLSTNYSDIASFLPSLVTTAVNCGGLESTDSKYVNVNCQESNWYVKVRIPPLEKKYSKFRDSDIYLGTHSCTGYRSGDYLIFNEEYTTCNTSKTTTRDNVIYTNTLVYAVHDPVHNFIIREYRFKIHVECDMSKTESGDKNINNNHGNIKEQTVAGTGHFAVQMRFFSDLNYQHEFNGFPPSYMIGDNVYVKVQTRIHDYDIKMRLTDCYTKPTQASSDIYIYYLIKNGCPTESSVVITSKSTHETRFHFQDFEYANHPDAMFVHCNATFCHSNDYSSACEPRCNPRKRKGGKVTSEGNGPIEYADAEEEIKFVKVPQYLKKSENNKFYESERTGKPGYVVAAVVVGVSLFASLIAMTVYFKKKRMQRRLPKVV